MRKSHLTSRMSNRAINEHAYLVAYERQKICGDLPETTAFKSYAEKHERKNQLLIYRLTRGQLSPLDAQRSVRGYPGIVNDIQPCPKRCLLIPLALLGARTDAPRVQLQCEAWPIFAHAHWCAQYAPRVLHFSAFHCYVVVTAVLSHSPMMTDEVTEVVGIGTAVTVKFYNDR